MSMEQDQGGHALLDMWYKLIVMIGMSAFIITKPFELYYQSKLQDILICARKQDVNFVYSVRAFLPKIFEMGEFSIREGLKFADHIKTVDEMKREKKISRSNYEKIKKSIKQKGSN